MCPGAAKPLPCELLSPCSRAHALPHEKPKHHSGDPAQPIYIHTHIHIHTHIYMFAVCIHMWIFKLILMGRGNLEHNFKSYCVSLNFDVLLIVSVIYLMPLFFKNSICISAIYLLLYFIYLFSVALCLCCCMRAFSNVASKGFSWCGAQALE